MGFFKHTGQTPVYANLYVEPHEKPSRLVVEKDIMRVITEGQILFALCTTPHGRYQTAFAVAHPQIDNKDPLCFFVTRSQNLIINPRILRHTNAPLIKKEGCMSFPHNPPTTVERFYRCMVEYQTITDNGELTEPRVCHLKGLEAEFYQHEIDHLSGKYIYPISAFFEMQKLAKKFAARPLAELKQH